MEDFADPSVNEITAMVAAQSAKTLTMLVLLAWAIAEDPGPILWVTKNTTEARKFAKTRLMPLLERCVPVAEKIPTERYSKTTLAIYFPGAPLVIASADNPADLQSTPYRYIFLDEVRSWKPGRLEMVSKRTRSYPHNYKKVVISTPDMESDAMHRAYLTGDQRRWFVKCPSCGKFHELEWGDPKTEGGLKWDKTEETCPHGQWDWDELAKTLRYECWNPKCDHVIRDSPVERKPFANDGRWIATNTRASSNSRSYGWNALLPWWTSWMSQVKEFLIATKAMKTGAWEPLKDHMNETRGVCWSLDMRFLDDEGFLKDREVTYDPTDHIEVAKVLDRMGCDGKLVRIDANFREMRRILSADVQGKDGRHFYIVIRAWGLGPDGQVKSRLLHQEKVWSYDEVFDTAKEWYVAPDDIVFDAAKWSSEIYQIVLQSGKRVKAFRGDDRADFGGKAIGGVSRKKIWSKSLADPAIGTKAQGSIGKIPLYLFSKPSTCERLEGCITGRVPGWEIFPEVDDDYRLQVTAYYLHEWTDTRGRRRSEYRSKRAEHYADAERMQIAAADITGIFDLAP